MQRTIEDATKYLEETVGVTPRSVHDAYTAEVHSAREAAYEMAIRSMDSRATQIGTKAEEAERGLKLVRNEYRQLFAAAESGRIAARECSEQHVALRRRQRDLERWAGEVERAAEVVRTIEEDPQVWADKTFYGKYPLLRPQFSF